MGYTYDKPDNLVELIQNSVEKYADRPLFGTKNANGEYEWVTYREVGERTDHLRGGLATLGIDKGDAVGIIANNRTEWAIAAFATYGLGGRFIPMYENELVKIWKYIIINGNIRVLLVATQEIYDQVQAFRSETPELEAVYLIPGDGENTMKGLEQKGQAQPVPATPQKPDDIAVLIYTSGTTGNPKGVLLSHGNFSSNFQSGGRLYPQLGPDSRSISILPWAHSFGQTAELYNFIWHGGSVGFMENVTTLADDMAKLRPTFLIGVPRIFNKIYDGLRTKMDDTGGIAKKLFTMGVESAKRRRELAEQGKSEFLTNLKFGLADKVVFQKVRDRFGGQLLGAISGSATMNVEISHFFNDIGIPIYDCYGLTETSPAATMNCPAAHRPGSVGKPLDQVRVVIDKELSEPGADDGEIIIYGPNVMHGYHNNPEATQEVMTEDGGFRTGDRGRLDEDGYLHITGRIKEQYKLENGKYVFPVALEEEIKLNSWVEHAMIYGEGKAYNVCLVVPDMLVLEKYAKEKQLPGTPEEWILRQDLQEIMERDIVWSLKGKFGGYEIPKKFIWLTEEFSLENGMLTQTMKLKRRGVMAQHGQKIESLYAKR